MSSSAPERRSSTARTLLAAAALLTALLALVALASRGALEPEGAASGVRLPLPGGLFAYAYALLILGGMVALPLFFAIGARDVPYSRRKRRRARLLPLTMLGVVALLLVLAARFGDELAELLGSLRIGDGHGGGSGGERAVQPPPVEWLPLVVVSSFLLAGGGGLLARRRLRRRHGAEAALAESLSTVLDDTLDDLEAEPDARRAIILAYRRMEAALESSGVPRHRHEAPLEYLARVLGALYVSAAPVHGLTDLFERAKFSRHSMDATMKTEAIAALGRIRHELRAMR